MKKKKYYVDTFKTNFHLVESSNFRNKNLYFLFGKFKGKDYFGNKYYQNKSGKRWIIYNGEVDATKIPNEWYSWMHYLNNKIEHNHELKNLVGKKKIFQIKLALQKLFIQIKMIKMTTKNINLGKIKFLFFTFFFFYYNFK